MFKKIKINLKNITPRSDRSHSIVFQGQSDFLLMRARKASVDLSDSSTTTDLDFDVDSGKSFGAANEKWLLELESEGFWLDFVERSSVDFDEAFAGFAESDSGGSLLSAVNLDVVAVSWGWHF